VQWQELYAELQPLYAQVCAARPNDAAIEGYPAFFLRYVVDATKSSPWHSEWLRELAREFIEGRAAPGDLSQALAAASVQVTPRQPSLDQIEQQLFRVADRILFEAAARIEEGAPAESLGFEPELLARINRMLADAHIPVPAPSQPAPEMPATLARHLARKAAAAAAFGKFDQPRAGQIVAIETLTGPEGEIDEDLARPLCALIDRPTDTPNVYWGWMVGAEPDYASEADFILTDDDEPRDPIAATVQLWNPVRIFKATVAYVVGQLAPQRLTALRSMAADFIADVDDTDASTPASEPAHRPVTRRTAAGHAVFTGPAMGSEPDPRSLYQTMYLAAADVLMLPALQAEATWAAQRQSAWLQHAKVEAIGLYRFLVKDRRDPTHTLRMVFESPGAAEPLMMLQMRAEMQDDTALIVDGQRIEFDGGIARTGASQAAALARSLALPAPFTDWATAVAAIAGSQGATDARIRAVLSALVDHARQLAGTTLEVFKFAFGNSAALQPAGAVRGGPSSAAAAVTSAAVVVVAAIDSPAPKTLDICLLLPRADLSVDTVEVAVDGETVVPVHPVCWAMAGETVRIGGLTADPAWVASAQLRGGHLRIDLVHGGPCGSGAGLPKPGT